MAMTEAINISDVETEHGENPKRALLPLPVIRFFSKLKRKELKIDENGNENGFNPWEGVFKHGIPEDLKEPYEGFGIILHALEKSGAHNVLDVAMGAGRHAMLMAEAGYKVSGFDISLSALDLADASIKKRGLEKKIDIKEADMFKVYPYPDDHFDAAVALQAIYHGYPRDMSAAFEEIHRVVKPGGVIAFTISLDYQRAALGAESYKAQQVAERTYVPLVGREAGLPHFYPSEEMLLDMMEPHFTGINMLLDADNNYRLVLSKNNGE